jgi:ribosomal-protein-alanine N-acetyltransferase
MKPEDIDAVLVIDREAFPTEWPPPNLRRELDNRLAHYIVACQAGEVVSPSLDGAPVEAGDTAGTGQTGIWRRLLGRFARVPEPAMERHAAGDERIIGFAGIWVLADEAHVTTIATRAEDRRQGVGELLLQSVIHLSGTLQATIVTLEVRVSNSGAQALYTKYGFREVGLRRAYYTDNREDAKLMSTDSIGGPAFQKLFAELTATDRQRRGPGRYGLGS